MKYKDFLIFFSFSFLIGSFFLYKSVPDSLSKHQDIDSKAYISNAINFYNYNSFSSPNDQKITPYYSLGYAFFIGIVYKLFGVQDVFLIWIQILLVLMTAFLMFRIASFLFNELIGVIAFVLTLLNVGFVTFSQFILTEILLVFLYVLFLERFIYFLKNKNIINLVVSAFILGISVIVKPAAIYFIFPLLILLLFIRDNFLQKIRIVVAFSIAFYIPVVSYMAFNKLNYDNFAVAPLAKENLYFYFLPKVLSEKNNVDLDIQTKLLRNIVIGNKMSDRSWDKINKLFIENLRQDPILFIKIWMKNVIKTFLGLFTTNLKVLLEPNLRGGDISFFKIKGAIINRFWSYAIAGTDSIAIKTIGVVEAIWSILRYILCLIGVLFLFIKKRWSELFLFCSFILYFSMITGHDGCARFRMMFEPVLIILSVVGLGYLTNKDKVFL